MVTLPQNIITQVIIVFLSYYWHLALERLLPARSAGVEMQSEKESIDEDEGREEEIVRRWILKGRVQRSSISWLNTFLKWAIDMTLGIIWTSIVYEVLYGFVFGRFPKGDISHFLRNIVLTSLVLMFSLRPLTSLIGFIIIPAPRRPVFLAGVSALASIFLTASTMIVLRGIVKSNFVQKALMDITERVWIEAQRKGATPARLVDEL
ncbi:unnamed protein product [Clonostachys solani]|uniref:Uncharacterized protein n=1 Tax=Clonostachys solani TaxID=160281 RepID=A0A9P0ENH0_9HYPO|nr:unnamed protein product [Clonostachys solani]